jgi:hypothetical protein
VTLSLLLTLTLGVLPMRQDPTPQSVLLDAADLVDAGWSQQASARDADGVHVSTDDPHAVKFCPFGAIIKVVRKGSQVHTKSQYALESAAAELLHRRINMRRVRRLSIPAWNDRPRRTAAQVAKAMREAAAL